MNYLIGSRNFLIALIYLGQAIENGKCLKKNHSQIIFVSMLSTFQYYNNNVIVRPYNFFVDNAIRQYWLDILEILKTWCCFVDTNVALYRPTLQSSTNAGRVSSRGVDGDFNADHTHCTHTNHDNSPWWSVQLDHVYHIQGITITNRNSVGMFITDEQLQLYSLKLIFANFISVIIIYKQT